MTSAGESPVLSAEVREYVEEKTRIGLLATTRKTGTPWIQPLWFELDDDEFYVVILTKSIASHSIRRTGRATLCVDDPGLPYRFATFECTAEIVDSAEELELRLRRMFARYRPLGDPDPVIADYFVDGVVLGRLSIERVTYMPAVVELQAQEIPACDGPTTG